MGKYTPNISMEHAEPGDWKFGGYYGDPPDAKPAFLLYKCPCGCGDYGALQLAGEYAREVKEPERAKWTWDGNREAPTLTPSILHYNTGPNGERAGEHWHGYLKAGVFEKC